MRSRGTRVLLAGLFSVCLMQCAFGANAAMRREYTGEFLLNREIPVNLAAETAGHPRLVEVSWVRIEPIYGNAWAPTARIGWLPAVDATWRIRIELLDDKGAVLRHSRDEPTIFTGKAAEPSSDAMQYAEVRLEPMHWETRRHVAKIRVLLEPAEDPMPRLSSDGSALFRVVVSAVDGRDDKSMADAVIVTNEIHRGRQDRSHTVLYRANAKGECTVTFEKADLSAAFVMVQKPGYVTLQKIWSGPYSPAISNLPLIELPDRHVIEMVPAQTIGGVVQDQAGRPIPDAQVRIDVHLEEVGGIASVSRSVRTDKEGRWQLEGIPGEADSVSLGFKHPDYVSDAWANRHIRGSDIAPLRERKYVATMTKGLAVSGRVLDDQSRPVPRAAVVLAPAYSRGFRYEYAYTLSDASGQFRFGCADNDLTDTTEGGGSTGVLVEAPGYVPMLQRVVVEPNLAPLELRLSPGRAIAVRVVDANDRPIAGASALVHPLAEDPRQEYWLADTGDDGRVRIPHAPDREALLSVLKTGYVAVRDCTLPASAGEQIVKMKPAPKILGAVRDAGTGAPIGDFTLNVTYTAGGRARTGEPIRLQGGRFELTIDWPTTETLQLKILAAGYKPATSDSIRLEGTQALEFKLDADPSFDARALQRELGGSPRSEPVVVTGTVVDPNGRPVSGAVIHQFPFGGLETATDAGGRFKLRLSGMGGSMGGPIREVPYLLVRDRQRNLAVAMEFDQTVTEGLTIKLAPGVILSGKVTDVQGKEIPGARMSLTFWPGQMGYGMRDEPAGPDSSGSYEVRAVPADQRFSVNVTAEGYGQEYAQVRTAEAVNHRMELEPMVLKVADLDISGTVVDTEDKPVAGVNVYCYGRGQPSQRQVKTDPQGRFLIRGVCAGPAQIQANVTAGQTRLYGRVQTEGGATDVKIVVSSLGSRGQYIPAKPPSLIGKPLPSLADLGLESAGDSAQGQAILLCFFDRNQRPSRNTVTTLAKRAEELRQKGVTLIATQAAEDDAGTLAQWLKDQNIAVPVGSIRTDAKKTTFAWGVQSLPWLILTDARHKVVAEGFAISELDAKLDKEEP